MTSRKNIKIFDFNGVNVAKHWHVAGEVFAISDCLVIGCFSSATRLGNFEVRMGFNKADPGANNLCTYYNSVIAPDGSATVSCDVSNACGRYLTIQRTGSPVGESMEICELSAYATGKMKQMKIHNFVISYLKDNCR